VSTATATESRPAEGTDSSGRGAIRPDQHNRNRWLVVGVAALVVVTALVGAAVYFGTEHSNNVTPTTTPPVGEAVLDGLLLNSGEINKAMGATEMTVSSTASTLNDSGAAVSPPECQPVASPVQTTVYAGSGWSAVRKQSLREPSQQFAHGVFQAVVLFPSPQAAAAFVSAASKSWSACANRGYSLTAAGRTGQFTVGPVSATDGILSAASTAVDGNSPPCQRALTAANNVVIEATACMANLTDQAASVARQIAAKIPQ
jgi:serine/threonine-protein kinase